MPAAVLHVLARAELAGTGIARIVASLARNIDPGRYRIEALFLSGPGALNRELRSAGVRSASVGWLRGVRDPIGAARFGYAVKRGSFEIVHLHSGGRLPKWLAHHAGGARVVTHLHGVADTVAVGRAHAIIATSESVARLVPGRRVHVVYPGIDPPLPYPLPETPPGIIGFAGRLTEAKGVFELIRAHALITRRLPEIRLEIAGDGQDRRRAERLVDELGTSSRVTFLGWRSEIAALHARWAVFALPSRDEGFGISGLEAMLSGVPVVGTEVGGVPELLDCGRAGVLVPVRDHVSLATGISDLLVDDDRRRRLGQAGRRRALEHFSATTMSRKVTEIYDRLMEADSPLPPPPG